jgi:hypothetical protein
MSDGARREYNRRFVERPHARQPAPREKYLEAVTNGGGQATDNGRGR